jgi:uncharacterized protein (TIGR02145 family)
MKKSWMLMLAWMALSANGQDAVPGNGVAINGVEWATANVETPGTFAANPWDFGKYYQFGRLKAWNLDDPYPPEFIVEEPGRQSPPPYETDRWTQQEDPCPAGWRVPDIEDVARLMNTAKVTSQWTAHNDVNGRSFTDNATGASIFLPAADDRPDTEPMMKSTTPSGYYWTSTTGYPKAAYYFNVAKAPSYVVLSVRALDYGYSIRCVRAE